VSERVLVLTPAPVSERVLVLVLTPAPVSERVPQEWPRWMPVDWGLVD
jgi:hypothetical protein